MEHCYYNSVYKQYFLFLREETAEEVKHIYKVKGIKITVDKSVSNL